MKTPKCQSGVDQASNWGWSMIKGRLWVDRGLIEVLHCPKGGGGQWLSIRGHRGQVGSFRGLVGGSLKFCWGSCIWFPPLKLFLLCIWRQLEKEGGSEFSFFRQDGSGIIAVRRGGFLKRNNSWRSCRNKTLHNGCHKLKKILGFFCRQNRSHFRNPERNYYVPIFLEKYCLIF